MPYIKVQITRENVTSEQKLQIIQGATDLMVNILNKDPEATFVVIEEVDTDNWGVAGEQVTTLRKRQAEAKKLAEANKPK
ncbi:tautomerase family protein [Undibacterium terreum]|uniref:Tautomerase n=1 Tax=Undibacterium terreum TaxID=1224302 RepID=A0A916ULG5_9BURK|nr:4-oxalocrotonate tautomerase family protein [Undibacterium terreum]GGC77582.1 tautomerase [Undibacterium terreum]